MINAENCHINDHEDGQRIVIEVPGTAHVTSVMQRGDHTYVTLLPVEDAK